MPRAGTPNNAAAVEASTAARVRAKHNRWAAEMQAAGWTVTPPPADDTTSDRYTLTESDGLHRWTCTGCGRPSGMYFTKTGARRAAERHITKCDATPA